ncbi:MAG: transglutaminase-like domain-containing protein [Candidatus Pacebacteria bacterium]|nr:transglutaminase-like domain-containing protein [Candidatus Paceibacterota bacterium]
MTEKTGENDQASASTDRNRKPDSITLAARDYHAVYHGVETCVIESIEELSGNEVGVRINVASPADTFSHFLCAREGEDFEKLRNNAIVARFVESDERQDLNVTLKPVFNNQSESATYAINVRYLSTGFYQAQKMTGHPHIIAIDTEPRLHIGAGPVDEWVLKTPTPEEKAFAAKQWGDLVAAQDSPYERAKVLAKALMHDLWPHSGFPSDAMKVSPFEQYERMVSGQDKGYCANFAAIFVCACNALGIPARQIHIGEIYDRIQNRDKYGEPGLIIQGGSQHSVPEIFDEQLDQWVWMDLRYYALGAWIDDFGPLTLTEFHQFINHNVRRKKLKLLIYDMDKKTETLLPLDECPKQEWHCFTGWATTMTYTLNP